MQYKHFWLLPQLPSCALPRHSCTPQGCLMESPSLLDVGVITSTSCFISVLAHSWCLRLSWSFDTKLLKASDNPRVNL